MDGIIINIPYNIKIILFKSNKKTNNKIINILYLMHESKQIKFLVKQDTIQIDKWSNSVVIFNKINGTPNLKIKNNINLFLNSINNYLFNKIKFKGKGFRIKMFKKIKLIKFYFGRSHKTFYFIKNLIKKRINKYKFIILSINKQKLMNLSLNITKIKKINMYTLRGLRISRQIIYKRKGKKGTYI